jgi:ATP-dependent helicase/DNAse subunit B
LRRLLRDPLGFLWRYGLGWRSLELDQQPLAFSPATFGELVHELLRRAINSLEPEPGFGRASRAEIEVALEAAVGVVSDAWPLERAVPPSLLWRHTLDEAARRTLRGLTLDDAFQAGTRSWTELSFGQSGLAERIDAPWEAGREVQIPNTGVHFGGRIDRVDLRAGGAAVRISDYKAGEAPRNAHRIIIAQGSELQRVLYALAARQLLPDATMVVSRLVYLDGTSDPFALKEQALDDAISEVAKFVTIACRLGRSGSAAPGPDARDRFNDLRLALPADLEAYFQRKQAAFNQASSELSPLWSRP